MMRRMSLIVAAGALTLTSHALGQVNFHTGSSQMQNQIDVAVFPDFETFDPLQDYREAGLRIHVNDFAFVFTPCGFPNSQMYYPNGGVNEMINITREDGADFDILEMNVSHGFAGCDIFVWIRAYLDGNLVGEFDADVIGGDLIGLTGVYDEVHVASYQTADIRNEHNPANLNAIALDNVAYGTGGPSLSSQGSCPGRMTFDVTGATPGGNVAYIYAFGTGNVTIPSGPCAGTQLGLDGSAQLGGTATADGSGNATFGANVPQAACGRVFVQALDVTTCDTTNVIGI